jgi:acetyltransferase-like isoleucine patch superfamily enzyme
MSNNESDREENREDPRRDYREVQYLQFQQGTATRATLAVLGVLTWPVTIPLALLARLSDTVFRSVSEFLSLMPYFPGVILRYEFYRFALRKCGKNILVEFGTVFIYSDIEVGDNVLFGRFCIVHQCDIGSNVLIGERCTFLSGTKQHRFDRIDIPMNLQGGARKRVVVGDDCWIGSHAVVAEDIASGCVVGAGSVVTKPLAEYSIAVGSPARAIHNRSE